MSKSNISDYQGPIIVFDAMCVLCSANAQFVLRHDRTGRFRLASMQNETGAALYRRCGIDPANPESLIIVDGAGVLRDSDAVLAIYGGLGWPWKAISALRVVPVRKSRDVENRNQRLERVAIIHARFPKPQPVGQERGKFVSWRRQFQALRKLARMISRQTRLGVIQASHELYLPE